MKNIYKMLIVIYVKMRYNYSNYIYTVKEFLQ